jgi:hypothetical protein
MRQAAGGSARRESPSSRIAGISPVRLPDWRREPEQVATLRIELRDTDPLIRPQVEVIKL